MLIPETIPSYVIRGEERPREILSSWKEIAAYFGKGVRTVQRWEKEMSLPVHRHSGDCSLVFACPAELKRWALSGILRAASEKGAGNDVASGSSYF